MHVEVARHDARGQQHRQRLHDQQRSCDLAAGADGDLARGRASRTARASRRRSSARAGSADRTGRCASPPGCTRASRRAAVRASGRSPGTARRSWGPPRPAAGRRGTSTSSAYVVVVRRGLSRSGRDRRREMRGRRQREVADVHRRRARRRTTSAARRAARTRRAARGRCDRPAAPTEKRPSRPGHRLAPRLAARRVVGVGTEGRARRTAATRPGPSAPAIGVPPATTRPVTVTGAGFAVDHRAGAQRFADRRRQARRPAPR